MIALNHFNQLSGEEAVSLLAPCVAVLVGQRRSPPAGPGAAALICSTPRSG